MCGIVGFLSEGRSEWKQSMVTQMCHRLVHRGPDEVGAVCVTTWPSDIEG